MPWYNVYQSDDTQYSTVAVTDALQQKKLVMNGVALWKDPRGEKNGKTGILYPFSSMINNGIMPTELTQFARKSMAPAPTTGNRHSLEITIARQHKMRLKGFKEDLNGVQNNRHPSYSLVSLYFVRETLVYQAELPLNTSAEQPGEYSQLSVDLVATGSPVNGMGGAEMPPDGPGDGMLPPGISSTRWRKRNAYI